MNNGECTLAAIAIICVFGLPTSLGIYGEYQERMAKLAIQAKCEATK